MTNPNILPANPDVTVVFEHHGPHVSNPSVIIESGEPVNEPHEVDCEECRWHFNIIDTRPVNPGEESNAGGSIAASDEDGFVKLADAVKASEKYYGEGSITEMEEINDNVRHIYAFDDEEQ